MAEIDARDNLDRIGRLAVSRTELAAFCARQSENFRPAAGRVPAVGLPDGVARLEPVGEFIPWQLPVWRAEVIPPMAGAVLRRTEEALLGVLAKVFMAPCFLLLLTDGSGDFRFTLAESDCERDGWRRRSFAVSPDPAIREYFRRRMRPVWRDWPAVKRAFDTESIRAEFMAVCGRWLGSRSAVEAGRRELGDELFRCLRRTAGGMRPHRAPAAPDFGGFPFFECEALPEVAEVAITPEMLGRIAENIVSRDKRHGVFYTAATVVRYMCRSILCAALGDADGVRRLVWHSDAAELSERERKTLLRRLAVLRILDPAVGAGAFLIGMAEELWRCRILIDPAAGQGKKAAALRRKVAGQLYGVDRDAAAVSAARRRLGLWTAPGAPETQWCGHLVVGDSLAARLPGEAAGPDGSDDWEHWFPEVFVSGGFDLVIGNPPYVSYGLRGLAAMTGTAAAELKRRFPDSAEYKISLYALFMELAMRLCRPGGRQSLIVPDSVLSGRYFSRIRRRILTTQRIAALTLVEGRVFPATVGRSLIYLWRNRPPTAGTAAAIRCFPDPAAMREPIPAVRLEQAVWLKLPRQRFRLFFSAREAALAAKIEAGSHPLGEMVRWASGLIGKYGQNAICSPVPLSERWRRGIASGSAIRPFRVVGPFCCLHDDEAVLKSGFGKVDYAAPKLFLRQTGDRPVCAWDDAGLLALNNVHVGNARRQGVSLKALAVLLNSRLLTWYYRAVTLERGRALAQLDLDMVAELPVKLPAASGELESWYDRMASGDGDDSGMNRAVYDLYGLNSAEIAVVENQVAASTPLAATHS